MSDLQSLLNTIPFQEHSFSAPLGDLHYIELGNPDGTPMIFFHGANMGIGQWYPNFAPFIPHFHIFAVDMYNAGDSATIAPAQNIPENYSAAGKLFLKHCTSKPAIIVGHSFGAWIAAAVATAAPQHVRNLILVGPVGIANRIPIEQNLLRIPVLSYILLHTALRPTREHIFEFISSGFAKDFLVKNEFIQYILNHALRAPKERNPFAFAQMIIRNFGQLKIERELVNAKIPTLIIVGKEDRMIDHQKLYTLLHSHPEISIDIMSKAGHVPGMEQPEQFNVSIQNFLNKFEHNISQ